MSLPLKLSDIYIFFISWLINSVHTENVEIRETLSLWQCMWRCVSQLQESHRAQSWAPPLLPIHKGAWLCFTLVWLLLHCFVDNTKHYSPHSLNLILRQSHASLLAWQVSWSGCQVPKASVFFSLAPDGSWNSCLNLSSHTFLMFQ